MLTQEEKELLREATLAYLGARHVLAFGADAIGRHIRRRQLVDFDFTDADILSACKMLCDLKFAEKTHRTMGAVDYYTATADGVLEAERSGLI